MFAIYLNSEISGEIIVMKQDLSSILIRRDTG